MGMVINKNGRLEDDSPSTGPLEREQYEEDRVKRLRPMLFWLEIMLLLSVIAIATVVLEVILGLPPLTLFLVLMGVAMFVKIFSHNPSPPI